MDDNHSDVIYENGTLNVWNTNQENTVTVSKALGKTFFKIC